MHGLQAETQYGHSLPNKGCLVNIGTTYIKARPAFMQIDIFVWTQRFLKKYSSGSEALSDIGHSNQYVIMTYLGGKLGYFGNMS